MKRRVLEMIGISAWHKVMIFRSDKDIDRYLTDNDIFLNDVSKFRFDLIITPEAQFINDDGMVDSCKCRLADIYTDIIRGSQIVIKNVDRRTLYYDNRDYKSARNRFWDAIERAIRRSIVDSAPNYCFKVITTYDEIIIKEVVYNG